MYFLYRVGSQDGLGMVADTGDKASAGNRVTAGKAAIGARHVALVAGIQTMCWRSSRRISWL